MAGTDRTQPGLAGGPPVILVRPQLGENVGAAARAMLNCGLTELRLVAPRDGWPSARARAAASGADAVVDAARVYPRLEEATADLTDVLAATARPRDGARPVLTPRAAGAHLRALVAAGRRPGLVVGPEREGLTNGELSRADTVVTARLNPAFASLNLAQAVLLLGYEWLAAGEAPAPPAGPPDDEPPAPKAEVLGLLERLEGALGARGFLDKAARRPVIVGSLRALLQRAHPTSREVRLLHGVVSALAGPGPGGDPPAILGRPPDQR